MVRAAVCHRRDRDLGAVVELGVMDGRSKRIAKRRVALWAKNHSYGNETIPPPAAATPIPPPALPSGPNKPIADINCSDFSTHAAAQQWFRQHGGSPSNNVAGLDHDHDGLACESLP